MWDIILKNRRQEVKTACKIVQSLKKQHELSYHAKTLLVQNLIREMIVELTEKINKKGG